MSRIGTFVKEARKWLKFKQPVVFVVGNESCDLDSAVCAVGLAYFYMNSTKLPDHLLIDGQRRFLPMMNISRTNLPLKTEVTYFMKKHGIDIDDLICCNEVTADLHNVSKFILVDHHVATPLIATNQIIQIFDHRPMDVKNAQFSSDCKTILNEVGSCATLIFDEIRTSEDTLVNHSDLIRFLWAPIVLDTINFSESADKARSLDIECNSEIEKTLNLTETDRLALFKELVKARSDVSSLSAFQLLSKDLKVISNQDKSYVVAIPGFPILVENYVQKENALGSIEKFGKERNCNILVLMGLTELENGGIRRDIGIIALQDAQLTKQIMNELCLVNREYLQLETKISDLFGSVQGLLFEQKNIKASCKQILPMIQKILDCQ